LRNNSRELLQVLVKVCRSSNREMGKLVLVVLPFVIPRKEIIEF